MKLYSVNQIRAWDQFTIEHEPIPSIELMERASQSFVDQFVQDFSKTDNVLVVCGPGNNGGDGLAIARLLKERGWSISVFVFTADGKLSTDAAANLDRLNDVYVDDLQRFTQNLSSAGILIDALFGSGISRVLDGQFRKIVELINASDCLRISVDMPSGLPSDSVSDPDGLAVEADMVYTFQVPKRSLLVPEHARFAKAFKVLDIGLSREYDAPCAWNYTSEETALLPHREKFNHKGSHGRAALMGGSKGMGGAMVLATTACLKSGVGLCTAIVPSRLEKIIHTSIPDATLQLDDHLDYISQNPSLEGFNVLGVGPGLGTHEQTARVLHNILTNSKIPLVLDADALNIIAAKSWQKNIPEGSIITPHPKEFERLFGKSRDSFEAVQVQSQMSAELGIIIIRKGAHTSISHPDGRVFFNSTGNVGMAKGGSGDVLTGILVAFLAQGLNSFQAAISAVFYHGRAGDRLRSDQGERAMLASELADYLLLV